MNVRSGLTVVGTIAILAIAGCGLSASSATSASAGASASTVPMASSGASASSASSAQPSWAKALGSGVTVTSPSSMAPDAGSPGAVIIKVEKYLRAGKYSKFCSVLQPSKQASCKTTFGSAPASAFASAMPTFKNFVVGYTAIDGDKALVGTTGTVCTPSQTPKCDTNGDPAAIFSTGKSFAALWAQALAANASNTSAYALLPIVKVNGTWYADTNG
jgi:hypothetical protein